MLDQTPTSFFESRIISFDKTIEELDGKLKRMAAWRLVVFLLILSVGGWLIDHGLFVALCLFLPASGLAFGLVVKKYNQLDFRKIQVGNLIQVNRQEIDMLNHELDTIYGGERFTDKKHPYTADLDIFGNHSIFKLINKTTTEFGEDILAQWLAEPAPHREILERQDAVRELTPEVDWRQTFQASGMHHSNYKRDFESLLGWMQKPNQLLKHRKRYILLAGFMAIVSTVALAYFLTSLMNFLKGAAEFNPLALLYIFLIVVFNGWIIKRIEHLTEELIEKSQNCVKTLGGYELLFRMIESKNFESDKLIKNRSKLIMSGNGASAEISKLKGYMELFQQRGTRNSIGKNYMYHLLNSFFLLDVYFNLLIEKWREENGKNLEYWAVATGEFEVLAGIAAFSYLNPDFSFPSFSDKEYCIKMVEVCHPLISSHKRVPNDFELDGQGKIAVITGSNMAGKSTFLRTLGVNLVLAYMGAPCAARSTTVSFLTLFTSMRVQDDISEGASSFYAELVKIEQLLTVLETGDQVFFLLDEIFKGTNSKDRYRGGVSLIKQLSGMNSFGVIATHDLELANLAERNMNTLNYSFNSKMSGNEMLFDYKISKGICSDFNASELMKRSGIKLIPDR